MNHRMFGVPLNEIGYLVEKSRDVIAQYESFNVLGFSLVLNDRKGTFGFFNFLCVL